MVDTATSPATPPAAKGFRRFLDFFLVRLIIALVIVGVPAGGLNRLLHMVDSYLPTAVMEVWRFIRLFLTLLCFHGSYILYVRIFERRKVREFASSGVLRELGLGFAVGFGIIAVTHGFLAIAGVYTIDKFLTPMNLIYFLFMALMSGYTEELFLRGIFFRLFEQGLGSWIAIIVSSLVFGFGHLNNPNATILSSVFISIEAGVILAAAFMYTGRLWLPMAIHFAWNFSLGGLFGTPVSGISRPGMVEGVLHGPTLLTGGEFGIEASLPAALFATAVGIVFLVLAYKRGSVVPVPWRRPKVNSSSVEEQFLEMPQSEPAPGESIPVDDDSDRLPEG